MNLTEAIDRLREANEPVPTPLSLPTEQDVSTAERELGILFPADYRRFLLEASDVACGTLEPFVLTAPGTHLDLVSGIRDAWQAGVPKDLLPFCEDNGDYFCIDSAGRVTLHDHNGSTEDSWPDLATWIAVVWLEA